MADSPSPLAVETRGLTRAYRTRGEVVQALRGIDLRIERGQVYGILGPNGAGKTTLIKVLVTLLLPTEGEAFVDGLDVVRQFRELRHRISMVSGGEHSGYGPVTLREHLWMFSQFYGIPGSVARARIEELIVRLNLTEARDRKLFALSSGMRQKANLIRGLVTDPRVLFLDEPTVALDVGAARDVREEVRRWMDEDPSRTTILTTHYMHEADELCDRIAIVNNGMIVAEGTPSELKRRVQQNVVIDLQLSAGSDLLDELRGVSGVETATVELRDGSDLFSLIVSDDGVLARVLATAERGGRQVRGVQKREPTLEDAFVTLTGRRIADDESTNGAR
ncbi:MAG: ABC transporter ATP-binding protein [Candidatus Dormibacteria bacterium]